MNLTITPALLRGAVTPPPSKSQTHRLIIAAALARGESVLSPVVMNRDIEATLGCVKALGANWTLEGDILTVRGASGSPPDGLPQFACGESGSTLRFMLPVALAVAGGGVFTGKGRLMERPLGPYETLFREKGVLWEQVDGCLTVKGRLEPGIYRLPGNVSSQFFTGLLFALPLLPGPSAILPTTQLESMEYITMTCAALEAFGITTMATMSLPPQYHVQGPAPYRPARLTVERDWSQAAFWYAAGTLGNAVEVRDMNPDSLQGDRASAGLCRELARSVEVEIDLSGIPDLAPPLAAAAAVRDGVTRFTNAYRLRLKESDRLSAIAGALGALGAQVEEQPESLTVRGSASLRGGCTVDCRNDHRIAMMLAVAATRCREPVTLEGAQCVEKSYPGFWEDYQSLGGIIHEHSGE